MWAAKFFLLMGVVSVFSQNIELNNNGYENILVAISDKVEYDADLLRHIKVGNMWDQMTDMKSNH